MIEEIPAFLWYLQNRTLAHYTKASRFAIPDQEVETKALLRIKQNSQSQLKAMISEYLQTRFQLFKEPEIRIDALRLYEQLFPEKSLKFSNYDIGKCLKNEFGAEPSRESLRFKLPILLPLKDDEVNQETGEVIEFALEYEWKSCIGKVYKFKSEDFLG
jgi:hypothetical protein